MTMSIFNEEFIHKAHEDAIFKDGIAVGEERGRQEGINEGISIGEERARESAHKEAFAEVTNTMTQKMIEEDLPGDTIARISGLSIDEVNALGARMGI